MLAILQKLFRKGKDDFQGSKGNWDSMEYERGRSRLKKIIEKVFTGDQWFLGNFYLFFYFCHGINNSG